MDVDLRRISIEVRGSSWGYCWGFRREKLRAVACVWRRCLDDVSGGSVSCVF